MKTQSLIEVDMQKTGNAGKKFIIFNKLSESVNCFSKKFDSTEGWVPEIIVISVFLVFHCFGSVFHEACFDEAHAWNIARDATLSQVFWEIPHWEGHPSLWHMILMPLAKLGVEYQVSMLIVTSFFSFISIWLILFKSPFPRIIRCLLPFTYFLFYQYSIIARPYCMMVLAFFILACLYKSKDNRPFIYTLGILFLCSTSAFGVAFSAGISCSWLIDILREHFERKNYRFLRDKRLVYLFALLLYVLFMLYRAYPQNEIGAMSYNSNRLNGMAIRAIYLIVGVFSDLFLTNVYSQDYLADFYFKTTDLIIICVIGTVILFLVLFVAKKYGTFKEFVIPYSCFLIFSVYIYFCVYNIGIPFVFIIYWSWITVQKNENKTIKNNFGNKKGIEDYLISLCLICLFFPLVWGITSYNVDIKESYTSGMKEAAFITEHELDDYEICVDWPFLNDTSNPDKIESYDLKHNLLMDRLLAYNSKLKFVNWPLDYSLPIFYNTVTTEDEQNQILNSLMSNTKPAILIGEPKLWMLNGNEYDIYDDYVEAFRSINKKVWKGIANIDRSVVFVRKDIVYK